MTHGRIYDDIFPLNIAGRYCCDLTLLVKEQLDYIYPDGWEANTHMLLLTREGAPHVGNWHVDAPPYEEDHIVMISLSGEDEIELEGMPPHIMRPMESLIFPAGTRHRGRCSTHRITYHCRVGPTGKVMPESPMDKLPPMTIRRFFGRTWRTLKYWLWPHRS